MPLVRFSVPALCAASLSLCAVVASAQTTPAVPTAPGAPRQMGTAQVAPNPALAWYNEALQLTDDGYKAEKAGQPGEAHAKYEQARAKYRKILQTEAAGGQTKPSDANASGVAAIWANLALLSARERKPDTVSLMQKAVVLSPKTGVFWQQLGAFQLQKRDWVGAAKSARKTLTLLPSDDTAQATLGIALLGQNKTVDALPVLRKRKLLKGETVPQADLRLLYALSTVGKKQEALTLAQKLAQTYPNNVNVQQMAGEVAMKAGDQATANKANNQAYALTPNDLKNGLKASIAAQTAGKYDDARKIAAKLAAAYPNDPRPHFQLGFLLFYAPDAMDTLGSPTHLQQAEAEFKTAALASPKNPSYLTYWGLSLLLQGPAKQAEAGRILKSALFLDKNAPLAHLGLAKIAEGQNNWEAAINEYQTVIADNKNREFEDRARIGLAGVLYTSGKKEPAYAQLEAVAKNEPTDTNALAQLASWLVKDNQINRAEATYQKIVVRGGAASPAGAEARVAVGQLMEKTGRVKEAQTQYEAALAANPQSANAALALGNLFLERKEPQEAVKVYEALIKNTGIGKGNSAQNNMVRWQLASVYSTNLSKPNDALKQMQDMVIRNDDPNRMVYQLGPARLLIGQSRYKEAIDLLISLRSENPKEIAVPYLLTDALEKSGKIAEAEAILRGLATPPPAPVGTASPAQKADVTTAQGALGGFYERNKKWDEAATEYETVLQTDAARKEAVFGLARVRELQKKPAEAGAFLESLALLSVTEPNFAAVSSAQKLYQQQAVPAGSQDTSHVIFANDKYKALTKKLVARYPKNRDALVLRVQVLMSAKERTADERTEAADFLTRLLILNPADSDANVQLGRLSEEGGQKAEAVTFYTKAIQLDRQNTQAASALRRLNVPFPGSLPPVAPTPSVPRAPAAAMAPPVPSAGGVPLVPRAVPGPKGGK